MILEQRPMINPEAKSGVSQKQKLIVVICHHQQQKPSAGYIKQQLCTRHSPSVYCDPYSHRNSLQIIFIPILW